MTRLRCALLAVTLLSLSAGVARAQVLYGVSWWDQLITINTTTGAGTLVGPISPSMNAGGLAFRGNKLYVWDNIAFRIRELNPASGAVLNTINVGAIGWSEGDMAFRSDGVGFLSGYPPAPLFRFDVSAGTSTAVGPIALTMDGIAFNSAGVLYGLTQGGTELHTINQTTGATTLVGNTGIPGVFLLGGLAFDASGNLYASLSDWPTPSPSFLYRINTSTGAGTLVGNIGVNGISGLCFGPTAAAAGAGNEGTYPGCSGPPGPEGAFGFGGRSSRVPILLGPFVENSQQRTVLNVASRQAEAAATGDTTVPTWAVLVSGLLLALAALVGFKVIRTLFAQPAG